MKTPETRPPPVIFHHTYDPLVGYSNDECSLPGIQVWPSSRQWDESDLRILTLGGSTTMWPRDASFEYAHLLGEWARFLGELLEKAGKRPLVFNAAACGYSSDQELLRFLRDSPGLNPHLVISMSGVNDLGFLHSVEPYPIIHRYQAYLAHKIAEFSTDLNRVVLGIPWKCEPHIRWLRNVRLCRAIAEDSAATYLACLQPLLGIPPSLPTTEEETRFLVECRERQCRNRGYLEEARYFYDSIRETIRSEPDRYEHVLDFTDSFAGHQTVWADQRHPNAHGNKLIAERLLAVLKTRKIV